MQEHQEPVTTPASHPGRPRPAFHSCLPSWFSVVMDEGTALVLINDNIGTFNNTAADLLAAIGDAQEVEFIINSAGGDTETAFQVSKALAGKVSQATIFRDCSSAAWIFALTAKCISMATDAHVLIHGGILAVVGSAEVLEMSARNLRKDDKRERDLFAARVKLPNAAFEALFDGNDHELTPKECLQLGLVDELFTPHPSKAIPADAQPSDALPTKPKTETEAEKLFMDMARAFGLLPVRNLAGFRRWFWDWSVKNVREET